VGPKEARQEAAGAVDRQLDKRGGTSVGRVRRPPRSESTITAPPPQPEHPAARIPTLFIDHWPASGKADGLAGIPRHVNLAHEVRLRHGQEASRFPLPSVQFTVAKGLPSLSSTTFRVRFPGIVGIGLVRNDLAIRVHLLLSVNAIFCFRG